MLISAEIVVAGEEKDTVLKVIHSSMIRELLIGGASAFIQNRHECLQHPRMRLIQLVKDEQGVGIFYNLIEQRRIIISDISCRGADEPVYRMRLRKGIQISPYRAVRMIRKPEKKPAGWDGAFSGMLRSDTR